MALPTLSRKLKKFPEPEEVFGNELVESESEDVIIGSSDSNNTSENDSDSDDAPEAESLTGGREVADAREDALKKHKERLQDLRKTKNKAREAFIQSTKSQNLPVAEDREGDVETEDTGNESDGPAAEDEVAGEIPRTDRLPDSLFAAAHESAERKRSKRALNKDAPAKRRRVREVPAEKIVNGRTLRVTTDINAPPAISTSAISKKAKNAAKGGSAFRRKWKKVDAARAQVRSRAGPPRNFVTVVQ